VPVSSVARTIGDVAEGPKIIVEKSTIPVKTSETIKDILAAKGHGEKFQVLSNPEFLAEGSAIADLFAPDRVLIGGERTPAGVASNYLDTPWPCRLGGREQGVPRILLSEFPWIARRAAIIYLSFGQSSPFPCSR
jgi:hypothetical protein